MEPAASHSFATGRLLHQLPLVQQIDDFASEEEVASLLAIATPRLQQALVSDARQGIASAGRSGRNCWVRHDASPPVLSLCRRISALVGIPLERAESLQVIHYGPGQQYAPHYDAWDAGTERGQRCMARGGQRLATCLLYLNTVTAGGGTVFPKIGLEIPARQGRLVLFHNVFPGTNQRHPDSLHGGAPVTEGEKWACNLWFREQSLPHVRGGTS
ncbi:prolyl hydroxylase family protein [Kineobactrum salinum]|uniref:2OG-Fe(II) oxygenase n=1 Tax=Kineobactrum salinum TaxID=2708301 RepID=A0A6C0U1G5_9GAMM|nr:2OG-Fe(II) oxygenase [Kineobactrum salinum]QIB65881.1 2OG-Fe(II) oxygenase [Kineobactrum salinum]